MIIEEWEKLTEENFCLYIENMPKQYKLFILVWDRVIKYWEIYSIE